jgi:hypothetical protein
MSSYAWSDAGIDPLINVNKDKAEDELQELAA